MAEGSGIDDIEKKGGSVFASIDSEPAASPLSTKLPPLHEAKRQMLAAYRQTNPGILSKLERTSAGFNTDQLMTLIMEDMLDSAEDLQGTTLLLESDGNLSGASATTIKRADLLRLIADIAGRKKELNQRSGELDLNSPAFMIFQKLCFDALVSALESLKLDSEMITLVISRWQDNMREWDKELKRQLKDLDD